MRLLFWILTLCFLQTAQAFAYVDETNADEAQMSAGDQNTNLFKMQAEGDTYIKKFKEINQLLERQGDSSYAGTADVDQLIRNSQLSEQEKKLDSLLEMVEKNTANVKTLRVVPAHDVYAAITATGNKQIFDTDIAASVLAEIRRIRR